MTTDNRWAGGAPEVDPWSALSLIVSGVLLWGLIGWGLASWLDAPVLLGLGLLVGGVLGVLTVYFRYGRTPSGPSETAGPVALPGKDAKEGTS